MKKILAIVSLFVVSISFAQTAAQPSTQMNDFITFLNGSETGAEEALAKYAIEDLETEGMDYYSLDRPKITKQELVNGIDTYTLQVKSGMTRRIYVLGWKNGKIVSVTDNGIVPGVIEKD